jgi:hypothetical protein
MLKTMMTLTLALAPAIALAEDAEIGRVVNARGSVHTFSSAEDPGTPLTRGSGVREGAIVKTGADGSLRLLMNDKSILDLGPGTQITIQKYRVDSTEKKRSVGLQLIVGRLWARVTKSFGGGRDFDVRTGTAVAGVRGTELIVSAEEDGSSEVICVNGKVKVENTKDGSSKDLSENDGTKVDKEGKSEDRKVSKEELKKLAKNVRGDKGLDKGKREQRLDNAKKDASKKTGDKDAVKEETAPEKETPIEDLGDNLAPPLDLEPGTSTGTTRVHARIQPVGR